MNPAGGLSYRHPLDPVRAVFKLQLGVDIIPGNHQGDFLKAADFGLVFIDHFDFPALLFRVVKVHIIEVGRKEAGFVPTGSSTDFHDDVLIIIRILRNQQDLQFLFQLFLPVLGFRQFVLRHRRQVRVVSLPQHFLIILDGLGNLLIFVILFNGFTQAPLFL